MLITQKNKNIIIELISLILIFIMGFLASKDLDLIVALRGESPVGWLNELKLTENFQQNFPGLVKSYASSLIMYVFIITDNLFSTLSFMTFFVYTEIIVLFYSYRYFLKSFLPQTSKVLIISITLLLCLSNARNINLARFHQPSYFGVYYAYAESFSILGICLFFKNKWILSYLFHTLSFMCHPVIGLIGGFLSLPSIKIDDLKSKSFIISLSISALVAIFWTFYHVDLEQVTSGKIPREMWFSISEMSSYHWFPVSFGIFEGMYYESLAPLLYLSSFFFLGANSRKNEKLNKYIKLSTLFAVALITISLINSIYYISPTLTKLGLHRASGALVPLLIVGIIYNLKGASLNSYIFSIGFLFSSYFAEIGFSLIFVVLMFIYKAKVDKSSQKFFTKITPILPILLLFVIVFINTGKLNKFPLTLLGHQYYFVSFLLLLILVHFLKKKNFERNEFALAISIIGSIYWMYSFTQNKPFLPESKKELAASYKEVQIWAKNNTKKTDFFHPDPTISYGWRDLSQRSTMGSSREWLFSSWSYNGDFKIYKRGQEVIKDYGINLEKYFSMTPPLNGVREYAKDIKNKFYQSNDAWRIELSKKYSINYFVMKNKTKHNSKFSEVFKNKHFTVLKVRH